MSRLRANCGAILSVLAGLRLRLSANSVSLKNSAVPPKQSSVMNYGQGRKSGPIWIKGDLMKRRAAPARERRPRFMQAESTRSVQLECSTALMGLTGERSGHMTSHEDLRHFLDTAVHL